MKQKIIMMPLNIIKNIYVKIIGKMLIKPLFEEYRVGISISSEDIWSNYIFKNKCVQALKPWLILRKNIKYSPLAELAIELCRSVPDIGGLERTFNPVRCIHT